MEWYSPKSYQWYYKRFSIGLFLDTSIRDFKAFVCEYHRFIDNFYFSLPMGDKFHSRRKVVDQFRDKSEIDKFWKLLEIVKSHDIKLEVLFNTAEITETEIWEAKKMLDDHGIVPELVGFKESYFEWIQKAFPNCEYVYSFNNYPQRIQDFDANGHKYAEYVVGRNFIRDPEIYTYIKKKLSGKLVLLVNNGCSFICGGCDTSEHCRNAYCRAKEKYGSLWLYALQSVMPFEIREGLLPSDFIDLIKINSRNANLIYVRKCIMSYIFGHEEDWIAVSADNYALWAHLTWHIPFFSSFNLEEIKSLKYGFSKKNPTSTGQYPAVFYHSSNLEVLYLSPYTEYYFTQDVLYLKNQRYCQEVKLPLEQEAQKALIYLLKRGMSCNKLRRFLSENGLEEDVLEGLLQGCVIE